MDWQLPKVRNRIQLLALFVLGAILAGAAELPFGGWIQIPLLTLIWWQLHKSNQQAFKHYFVASMSFGLGYFVLVCGGSISAFTTLEACTGYYQ